MIFEISQLSQFYFTTLKEIVTAKKTIKTFRKRDSIIFVSDLLRVVPCVVNDKFLNLVTNNFSSQTTV